MFALGKMNISTIFGFLTLACYFSACVLVILVTSKPEIPDRKKIAKSTLGLVLSPIVLFFMYGFFSNGQ